MGCDIHIYAEKKNKETGKWEKVGHKFVDVFYSEPIIKLLQTWYKLSFNDAKVILKRYLNQKEPRNKAERHIFKTLDMKISNDPNFRWWDQNSTGKYMNPKTDQPYSGRNYNLFGALAGVRSDFDMITDYARGLPNDVSDEVCEISDSWDVDGHSHNYITLRELIDNIYYKMSDEELDELELGTHFFRDVINDLKEIGNPDDVRIVFCFDN